MTLNGTRIGEPIDTQYSTVFPVLHGKDPPIEIARLVHGKSGKRSRYDQPDTTQTSHANWLQLEGFPGNTWLMMYPCDDEIDDELVKGVAEIVAQYARQLHVFLAGSQVDRPHQNLTVDPRTCCLGADDLGKSDDPLLKAMQSQLSRAMRRLTVIHVPPKQEAAKS